MTAQTYAQLQSAFADGGGVGNETPLKVRNLIDSMPMPNIVRAPFRPDFPSYSCDFTGSTVSGTVSANTSALAQICTDITSRGGGEVICPEGQCFVNAGSIRWPSNTTIRGAGRGDPGTNSGTIFQRQSGSAGVVFDTAGTADTSDALQSNSIIMDDFAVYGDGSSAGALIRWMYGSKCFTRNVCAYSNQDPGFHAVAMQDSGWDRTLTNWCGQGGTASNGATIGQSAFLISGAIAASGLGASANGCNNLTLDQVRVETFSAEGLSIQKNLCSAGTAISQIRVRDSKFESNILGGSGNNTNIIAYSNDAVNVKFFGNYFGADNATGNAGFIDIFAMNGYSDLVLRDSHFWVGTASIIKSIVTMAPGIPANCLIDQLVVNGVAGQLFGLNSGALLLNINPGGGLVPWRGVSCMTASTGTLYSPAYPPYCGGMSTTQALSANAQTVTVGAYSKNTLTSSGSFTGIILAAGSVDAQEFLLVNNSSNTITWNATDATAHLKAASGNTVAANSTKRFTWDSGTSLWWVG